MKREPVPAHWIRGNQANRVPRRHVIFDTEAHQVESEHRKVQTFRCASAAFDHQSKAGRDWRPTERADFTTPRDLWRWVDACTQAKRRLVVVAHNVAYDLRVSDAFTILPELGYTLDMVRLDGGSTWAQWKRADRSLVCVDTVSWFGVGLDKIAATLRMTKPPLPRFDASDAEWFARCAADVEVLRVAWRRVLDWIDAGKLGNFKPTGAGQGWAFFRHQHMTHRILHHGVDRAALAERESCYAGRCEAWRHGALDDGPYEEWDFAAAYAQAAEETMIPTRLVGRVTPIGGQRHIDGREHTAALMRCHVTTDAPTAPHRRSNGILWPVGEFDSWLWDIEARQVVDAGGRVDVLGGWRYETQPALRQWAGWVLDRLNEPAATFDPLLRLVVKGWSRTTVGRFGAQWATWDRIGEAHGPDVTLWAAGDGDTGRRFRMMMVGGSCLAESERVDAPDSATHVLSWIMAVCRVKLWRAIECAGFDHVVYVDTDGVIVDPTGAANLRAAALPALRPKSRWRHVEVLGPRQLVLDGHLRASGVPSAAVRTGPRTWEAEVWRSLPASLRSRESDRVVITDRRFVMRGVDRRRVHLPGGLTAPILLPE